MTDTVLLTGISGFLGGHTALSLLKAGYRVRGSVRKLSKADKVRDTLGKADADINNLEFVELDLMSDSGWEDAMKGAKYLAHVASPFITTEPDDPMDLIRPAVEGTERALKAALAADVERIALTSSMAAVMYGTAPSRPEPYTGDDWTDLDGRPVTAYVRSKTLAEKRAWELMKTAGREEDLTVINPAAIFGPLLDEDPGTSGALLQRLLDGTVPGAPKIYFGTVDVRDVAEMHRIALEKPDTGGHRYPMSAETVSILEISQILAQAFPQYKSRLPRFELPNWLVRLIGRFDREIRANTNELGNFRLINASSAERVLGHKLIPAKESLSATAQSLIEHGLIKS